MRPDSTSCITALVVPTTFVVGMIGAAACSRVPQSSGIVKTSPVRPGITVLLADSIHLVRDRRIALLTNQAGIDERGEADIDLLRGARTRENGVRLIRLFSP